MERSVWESRVERASFRLQEVRKKNEESVRVGNSADSASVSVLSSVGNEINALQKALVQGTVAGVSTVEDIQACQKKLDDLRRDVDSVGKALNKNALVVDKKRILEIQNTIITQQDQALEAISEQVRRVANISGSIRDEVDLHINLLDDLESGVARGNEQISNAQGHAMQVTESSGTCKLWMAIVALVGVLLVILFI